LCSDSGPVVARPSAVDVAATLGHHLLWLSSGEASMPAQTTNLFLLEDLEDSSRTRKLADSDLNALRAVADWIKAFVARPNKDLGRPGPVCPFVGGASEGQTLWLTPEQIANQSVPDVVQLMNGYKKLLLRAQPYGGRRRQLQSDHRCFHRFVGGSCKRLHGRRPNTRPQETRIRGRWISLRRVLRRQRGGAIYNPSFRPFTPPCRFC
jgi:hypothetical protein